MLASMRSTMMDINCEKIAVLMAAYNGQKYIEEQVYSILSQTYSNIELIILDDCSTDNTYQILEKIAASDSRVTIFRNKKRKGVNRTFEKLLRHAKTTFFCFSDQDDVWDKDKIEVEYAYLKEKKI